MRRRERKRRFRASTAREENLNASSQDEEMQVDECDSGAINYDIESTHLSSPASVKDLSRPKLDAPRRALAVPRPSMQNSALSVAPFAGEGEDFNSPRLSHHFRELCKDHIFEILRVSRFSRFPSAEFYNLILECDNDIFQLKITCLRDLEETFLHRANVSTRQETLMIAYRSES
jgi:hypothetical protein